MKFKGFLLFFVVATVLAGIVGYKFYSYIFSKTVQGKVVGVERITQPGAIINNATSSAPSNTQMFSFAIAVQDSKTDEIYTGSSEDRQWAVVQKGQCAVAKFFPYPFWSLDKAGTYFGTRLIQLYECSNKPK